MASKSSIRRKLGLIAVSPLLAILLLVLLVLSPFFLMYRLALRGLVELVWGRKGRRILLVYSRSPVWQEHIESTWLPRLADRAVVLDWSGRARWNRAAFAVWVFRLWAPPRGFNPMAILFPARGRVRTVSFYEAFRGFKHGDPTALREAEAELFSFAETVRPRRTDIWGRS